MHPKGFTLIEVLMALFIMGVSVLCMVPIVHSINQMSKQIYRSDDIVALQQLRLMLAQGYNFRVEERELLFRFHGNENVLQLHNQRIVKRPGYEIFLTDIDHMTIQQRGECYELSWTREKTYKHATLVCE